MLHVTLAELMRELEANTQAMASRAAHLDSEAHQHGAKVDLGGGGGEGFGGGGGGGLSGGAGATNGWGTAPVVGELTSAELAAACAGGGLEARRLGCCSACAGCRPSSW